MKRLSSLQLALYTTATTAFFSLLPYLGGATSIPIAHAQTSQADALSEDGKDLAAEGKYFAAYKKFQEAIEIEPKGKYFYNACFMLNLLERYRDAIAACEQVSSHEATPRVVEKTNTLLAGLRQHVSSSDERATDPDPTTSTHPTDTNNNSVTVGRPPPGPVKLNASRISNSYRWSLGGEIGLFGNLGVGIQDGDEQFESGGLSLRVLANFLLSEQRRLGIQGHLGGTTLGPGNDSQADDSLSIVELGGGVYMHFPITNQIVFTPLLGLDIAFYSLNESNALLGLGLRGEASLAFLFGPGGKHALTITPSLTLYSPASGGNDTFTPEQLNLDKSSASLGLTFGYTMRFTTPFISTPLITLE